MFVARQSSNEAEKRLDRLERETRRKQVDSALMIRRADGTTAAERFFGKQLAELDVADSALLAGLIAEPEGANPFKNAQRAKLLEIAGKCPVHRTLTSEIDVRTHLRA